MSSSFCEYRPGHYHAGLDIKTWAKEGYQVFAIDSGYVRRILVSPYGYGKAIYLKLNNGWTVVYGHLSRFNSVLEKRVTYEQRKNRQYDLDMTFRSTDYPVIPGQLIAYTGKTGIGVPHLHFEVRDDQDRPFNPIKLGYMIRDNRPPTIQAVALTPLEYGSHVNGDFIPYINHFKLNGQSLAQPVPVWGKIGISVSVYDQADGASNRFSPVRLRLFADDSLIFQTEYTTFRYDQTHLITLERDFRLQRWREGEYQNLYLCSENSLPFFTPHFNGAGVLKCWHPPYKPIRYADQEFGYGIMSAGFHTIRIEADDYWGNQQSAYFNIDVKPLSEVIGNDEYIDRINQPVFEKQNLQKTWMHDYIRFAYHSDLPPDTRPVLSIWLNGLCQSFLPLHLNHSGEWTGIHPLNESFHGTMICQVKIPGSRTPVWQDTTFVYYIDQTGGTVHSEDHCFFCDIPPNALYDPMWFHIKADVDTIFNVKTYRIVTNEIPLKNSVQIRFKLSEEHQHPEMGIYKSSESISYIPSKPDPSKAWLSGRTSVFTAYTLLRDTIPPVIHLVKPDSGDVIYEDRFAIDFFFSDSLSGIYGEENYCIWIDSVRQIVAYDPEEDRGSVEHIDSPGPGMHWLRILIRDRAGNETKRQYPFYLRQ